MIDENGKLKEIASALEDQDAVTLGQINEMLANCGKINIWVNGILKTGCVPFTGEAVVENGNIVFSLTDVSNGEALFSEVYIQSAMLWVNDHASSYQFGDYDLSADKRTLTISVRKIALELSMLNFNTQPNGATVYLMIYGK